MCNPGAGSSFRNESAEIPVTFSPQALIKGLRAIYNKDIDVRTEIERSIFDETLKRFNEATAQGLAESIDPDVITDRFLYELRTNNAVFSAFKTHRMQNDIAAQLIDPKTGQLKSFDRWKLDIKGMTDHYCHQWLQTEYDTAVIRAHQAADWKHFLDEAEVFPNVRWMPTTSITPDPLHQHYWEKKLTLPVNHPFWQEHRPGDRWNCKCSLMQTDEPVNAEALDGYTPPLPMPGLDNNPASDGKLFSDTHPYYTEAYPGAQQAVDNFLKKRSPSSMRRTEEDKRRIQKAWDERKMERRRELYRKYKNDPDYENVEFNEKTGALKATHVEHNFDKNKGDYEVTVQDVGFANGHSVILESEFHGEKYQRFTEGTWDGMLCEIASRETGTVENIKKGLLHCASKRKTEVAIILFPKGGYTPEKLRRALGMFRGLEKQHDGQYIKFKRVVCIQDEQIVYDEPF